MSELGDAYLQMQEITYYVGVIDTDNLQLLQITIML